MKTLITVSTGGIPPCGTDLITVVCTVAGTGIVLGDSDTILLGAGMAGIPGTGTILGDFHPMHGIPGIGTLGIGTLGFHLIGDTAFIVPGTEGCIGTAGLTDLIRHMSMADIGLKEAVTWPILPG